MAVKDMKTKRKSRLRQAAYKTPAAKACALLLLFLLAAGLSAAAPARAWAAPEADAGVPDTTRDTQNGGPKTQATAPEEIPADYKLAADDGGYELYVYEPAMSVIVRNKQTGALLRSTLSEADDDGKNNDTWNAYMRSGVVITAIKGTTDTYQVDLVSCAADIDYEYAENGFSAKIYFKEYEFGLTVDVSLKDGQLTAGVRDSSVVEEGKGVYIGTVSLFPFLGYTHLDDKEGYMFIPDGNGALIYLDDKDGRYATGFSQMIYGSDIGFSDSSAETLMWGQYKTVIDPQKVLAPVFGMMHTADKQGYLAVVEEGAERASVEAHPNGAMVDYNRCYAKFLLRRIYVQPLNNSNSGTVVNVETDRTHSDLKVRYLLLSGEEADYSGMAVAYREYLLDRGLLSPKDTSYNTRVDFLGTDREQFLVFTRAVTMTTAGQIREIYEELKNAGVESLLTVYKGWQAGGYYDLPVTGYKADGHIGGTGGVTSLIKDAAKQDYRVYLYDNAVLANPSENNTTFSAVKKVNKRRLEINAYGYVYDKFNYLQPAKTESALQKFADSCAKKGVQNLALAGLTDQLLSYSGGGRYYSRFDCADSYAGAVEALSKKADIIMETPFSYLWKDTGAFLDMPMGASDYMYEDEEIPFFSIVLKGVLPMYSDYVNFEANKNKFRLQMAEYGVFPSFYLTYENSSELIYTDSSGLYSTAYDTYRDEVVAYDREFRELASQLCGAVIIKHETLQDGVKKVTYDNGRAVYVNYNEAAAQADGYTVEGLSVKVGESR